MNSSTAKAKVQPLPISLTRGEECAALSAVASGELDDLKFRIVRRGKRHYFSDVRFRNDEQGRNVVQLLQSHALEQLSPQTLRNVFGSAAIVAPLQTLVHDLQRVFC